MKTYQATASGRCIISPDGMAIPIDVNNRDYEEFLHLQSSGQAILERYTAMPEPEPTLSLDDLLAVLEEAGDPALKSALARARADKRSVR